MRSKWFVLGIALLVVSLLVAGCGARKPAESGGTPPAAQVKNPDRLVVLIGDDPGSLDPAESMDPFTTAVYSASYETLVRYDAEKGEVKPLLADSWSVSPDATEYVFKLHPGIKFTDGTELTAEAVKTSFDRLIQMNKGPAYMYASVKKIEVVDPLTVKFVLKSPFAPFLYVLAQPAGGVAISPKAIAEHDQGDRASGWLRDHMVGTGPYVLDNWVRGQQIILKQNPNYWRGWEGKHVKEIAIQVVKEQSSQRLLLEQGDADILGDMAAPRIPLSEFDKVSQLPGVKVTEYSGSSELIIGINCLRGPTKDVRVRKALTYALDYDGIIKSIYFGHARPAQGPIPYGLWSHDASLPVFKQDLEKAKQLLAEAGYPKGGFTLKFTVEPNENYLKIAQAFATTLAGLGIKVDIQQLPWATELALLQDKDRAPELYITGWYGDYPDPDSYMYPLYHSASWGANGFNLGYYKNAEVDRYIGEAQGISDQARRTELYQKAQKILVEEVPVLWVLNQTAIVAMRDWVKGFHYNPFGSIPYYDIYKE